MIRGFHDKDTEDLWFGRRVRRFDAIAKSSLRRLDALNAARDLNDLRAVPGNRLEALRGDRKGEYSIRINQQWRICFVWSADGPDRVEIVDYHS